MKARKAVTFRKRGDNVKLKIEIDPDAPREVVIRSPEVDDEVRRIQLAFEKAISSAGEIALKATGGETFVSYSELYFFEVIDEKVYAHTKSDCFVSAMNLTELSEILPRSFCRATKSSLINTMKIRSITRSPTGVGEASFNGTEKTAFISRMYYKTVRETIEEMRLKK